MDNQLTSKKNKKASIYEIQVYLYKISSFYADIPTVYPDGIFGPDTTTSVKSFQTRFNLPPTGIVDYKTWTLIVEIYDSISEYTETPESLNVFPLSLSEIKFGDRYDELYFVQLMLRKISEKHSNISTPELTGVFDQKTLQSVRDLTGENTISRPVWNKITKTYNSL